MSHIEENWMFKDTIRGLDRVFKTDITPPKLVLVTGPPGSMKSSFVYSIMSKYLNRTGEFGLYSTLEETVSSHLENMESLGIGICENMQISDFTQLRGTDEEEEIDYLALTTKMIDHFKETRGDQFSVFGFDSLGALYSLMEETQGMRKKMYHFFQHLRQKELYCFIIMERAIGGESNLLGNEGFLSDGIILLGLRRKQGKLIRYLQIEKMRATKHSMEMHALEVRGDGLAVLGPIFDQ